jgi:hypothetical protein
MSLERLLRTGLFRKLVPKDSPVCREQTLFCEVLDQALFDSYLCTEEGDDTWFDLDNPDFILICNWSLLDPELVLKAYLSVREIIEGDNAKL